MVTVIILTGEMEPQGGGTGSSLASSGPIVASLGILATALFTPLWKDHERHSQRHSILGAI